MDRIFRKSHIVIILTLFALILAKSTFAANWTLTNSPLIPNWGDYVTFVGTYDQAARKQSRQPQFPDNPNLDIFCTTDSGSQFTFSTIVQNEKKNADGTWTGTFYPVQLSDPRWSSTEGANCSATVVAWSQTKGNVVATTYGYDQFRVNAK